MELVIVFRHLSTDEKNNVRTLEEQGVKILSLPGFYPTAGSLPDMLVTETTQELISLIKNLGDKFIGDTPLSQLFTIGSVPIWHYQRFRVFFQLKNTWLINRCITYYSGSGYSLICYIPGDVPILSKDNGVIINPAKSQALGLKRNYRSMINYTLFFMLRVLISMFKNVNFDEKRHFVVDRSIRQQCRDIVTLKKKWDNYNLYPLFDAKPKGLLIISEVETPKFNSRKPFNLHNFHFNGEGRSRDTVYSEWVLFKGIINRSIHSKRKKMLEDYFLVVEKVNASSLNSEEMLVFMTFTGLLKSSKFYLLKFLCYSSYFEKLKITNIAAIDENSPATRCILDAARNAGAEVIGIQHGNIGDSHPAYIYSEADKSNKVMADKTIVWGKYWANFLIEKANFPSESIIIAGQMRSDIIPAMIARSEHIRASITNSPFLVVFASQPIPNLELRRQAAFDVFSSISNASNIELVVKLHPAERYAIEYYTDIANQAGLKDIRILYDVDLYDLLAACDLVITCYSTVGSEAVYFGKPLIIYDPYNEDLLGYIKEGVALHATNATSIKAFTEKIKSGELVADKQKYKEFIAKYAHAIDGNATRRTLEIISSAGSDTIR